MDVPEKLTDDIELLEPPVVVAVSGFGGSGKSSFAHALGQKITAPVVGIDSFIIDRSLSNFEEWNLIDFIRLEEEVLQPFKEGKPICYRHFDWNKNTVAERRSVQANRILIVEGVGLFRPNLLHYFSVLVWIDCPLHEATKRGKHRDRHEYGNPQDEAWDGLWRENDLQCYDKFKPKNIADFIINNYSTRSFAADS